MFCFTSRISSKNDSVGQVIFVNVSYEYYYRSDPNVSSAVAGKTGEISTTLLRFTLALTHNRSIISGAINHTQMDNTNVATRAISMRLA